MGPLATSANGRVVVALPDDHRVLEVVAESLVHGGEGGPVARDVHRHGVDLGQRSDVVVGEHVGVPAERLHEVDVARRREPDHPGEAALGGALREADRGLGRGREDDDGVGSVVVGVGEEGVGEEAGEEQAPQQRVAVLGVSELVARRAGRVHRVVGGLHVAAVDGSVRLAVVAVVAESVGGGADGEVDEAGHREPAVVPTAGGDVGMGGLDDVGPAHGRHPAPCRVAGREEVPVAEHVAEHRVGDVVGRHGEAVDPQPDLPRAERLELGLDQARLAAPGPVDLEHCVGGHDAAPTSSTSSARDGPGGGSVGVSAAASTLSSTPGRARTSIGSGEQADDLDEATEQTRDRSRPAACQRLADRPTRGPRSRRGRRRSGRRSRRVGGDRTRGCPGTAARPARR